MSESLSPKIDDDDHKAVVLLVDDDSLISENLGNKLSGNFHVVVAESRVKALDVLKKQQLKPQMALVDLGLPPMPHQAIEGFALIKDLVSHDPLMKVIVLSTENEEENISHALTLGAVDFIPKKLEQDLILERLAYHLKLQQIEKKDLELNIESAIIGESVAMKALREKIEQVGEVVYPVLIEGEQGTGKELIAQVLHLQGSRREKPYKAINCAAIAADLIEAQLFGRSNDATIEEDGLFADSGDGTLFLNEISELPGALQDKLLRVLECGEYSRVGESKKRKLTARLVAATDKNLFNESKLGKFNDKLYHHLSVLKINAPPLRERENDSLLLMRHFRRLYKDSIKLFTLDAAATALWMQYSFPGNIRELRNIVIRLGTKYSGVNINKQQLAEELELEVSSVQPEKLKAGFELGKFNDAWLMKQIKSGDFNLEESLSELESHCIQLAMEVFDNDLNKAADALKINRTTLFSRINKDNEKVKSNVS